MQVALIRHGIYAQPEGVPSAWLPQGLTEEGRAQSREAAELLAALARDHEWRISAVIDSSRMRRAWETASVIAAELNGLSSADPSWRADSSTAFRVQEFDALAERGVGALANLPVGEIARLIEQDPRYSPLPKGWKRDSHFTLPVQGAESLMQSGRRVADHVQRAAETLGPGELKLVVGHGGAIRHAAHLLGVLEFEQIAQLSMFYARPIVLQLKEGRFIHVAGDWKVRTLKERQLD